MLPHQCARLKKMQITCSSSRSFFLPLHMGTGYSNKNNPIAYPTNLGMCRQLTKWEKLYETSDDVISLRVSSLKACIGSVFELPTVVAESARIWLPLPPPGERSLFLLSKTTPQRAGVSCVDRDVVSICSSHNWNILEELKMSTLRLRNLSQDRPVRDTQENPYTILFKHKHIFSHNSRGEKSEIKSSWQGWFPLRLRKEDLFQTFLRDFIFLCHRLAEVHIGPSFTVTKATALFSGTFGYFKVIPVGNM